MARSLSARRNRILTAAVLLPAILFSLLATSFALWRCQYDGVARSSCCCPEGGERDDVARVSPASCCALERYEAARAPVELGRGGNLVVLVATVAALPQGPVVAPAPVRAARAPVPDVPAGPPGGRDLVIQKQAFLI
jgi:hypothetical protein